MAKTNILCGNSSSLACSIKVLISKQEFICPPPKDPLPKAPRLKTPIEAHLLLQFKEKISLELGREIEELQVKADLITERVDQLLKVRGLNIYIYE